jgi:hypothetical protein
MMNGKAFLAGMNSEARVAWANYFHPMTSGTQSDHFLQRTMFLPAPPFR